jgi:hypothetical protein
MSEERPAPGPDARGHDVQRRRQVRRRIAAVLVVAGLCLGVVVTRALWDGRGALVAGDSALERGEKDEAIRQWQRAARWYVPLAPHVGDAYARLESLALLAEERGDPATALRAWRALRGALYATRSLYMPHGERLPPTNRHIAALMAAAEEGDAGAEAHNRGEREAWHLALLDHDQTPSVGWTIVALLGFAMWIGGGLLFALRGVSAEDTLVPRTAAYAGILIAVGLLVWATGLYLA